MPKPELLFLCQTLPYPPHGGVEARTYNVLRQLATAFELTLLCFYRVGGATRGRIDESVEALGAFGAVDAFPIPEEHSTLRRVWNHSRSVLSGRVYTYYAYESKAFRRRLRELLGSRTFDLVHLDSLDLSRYLNELGDLPTVCVHHNVESLLLHRRGKVAGSWEGLYMRLQGVLMAREEKRFCPDFELNVCVSDADRRRLLGLVGGAETAVVPNGVDVRYYSSDAVERPDSDSGGGMLFVGGTSWFPNTDGMEFFCARILPLLRQAGYDHPVTWVGKAQPEYRQRIWDSHGVRMTGYVPDVRPYLKAASCYLVPLRVGGGTRLKILDGWSMGKATVSTTVGCEGLEARDGENILVRDDPEGFAEAVADVLSDQALEARLGAAARRTAEEIYSWKIVGQRMNNAYLALLNGA